MEKSHQDEITKLQMCSMEQFLRYVEKLDTDWCKKQKYVTVLYKSWGYTHCLCTHTVFSNEYMRSPVTGAAPLRRGTGRGKS